MVGERREKEKREREVQRNIKRVREWKRVYKRKRGKEREEKKKREGEKERERGGGRAHGEALDVVGEGGGEEEDLPVAGHEGDELVQSSLVVHGEEFVSLVENKHLALTGIGNAFL